VSFDRAKFKNLVHYVIWKTSGKDGFGATKLYKVLWFAEARAFTLGRQPITGETYIREEHGPVPQHARAVRTELVSEGLIAESKINRGSHQEWLFRALKAPPTNFINEKEKSYVDYWIKHIDEDHTAKSISDLSHDYGWEIAKSGEVLPLHALWADRLKEPTDEDINRAKARVRDLGLS
jgi:Protein of unknown function (DUF4065)